MVVTTIGEFLRKKYCEKCGFFKDCDINYACPPLKEIGYAILEDQLERRDAEE